MPNLEPLLNRLTILDKRKQKIPLLLNPAQRYFLNLVHADLEAGKPMRYIVLKARQMGLSTLIEGLIFTFAFAWYNSSGVVISHDKDSAKKLLAMTQRYWQTYPWHSLYSTVYHSRNELSWRETESSIEVTTAKSANATRSSTFNLIHASEVAFWQNASDIMLGMEQTLPEIPHSFEALESTANGIGNYFYNQWKLAEAKDIDMTPVFFPWFWDPTYRASYINLPHRRFKYDNEERILAKIGVDDDQLLWRRWAIKNRAQNDIIKFHQEYPACILTGTRVGTNRGILPVEQIQPDDITSNGRVVAVHEQPPTRCVRVTTAGGYSLDCTWHHPLVDSTGLLIPAEASLGRSIKPAPPRFASDFHVEKWSQGIVSKSIVVTPNLGRFIGYFMGDGYFSNGAISIVCDGKDTDVIEDVKMGLSQLGIAPRTRVVGSKGGGIEVRAEAQHLIEPFTQLGLVRRRESDQRIVRDVHVPPCIWNSPRPVVKEFLSALFEADGFSNRAQWDVRVFTRHKSFAQEIQLLLLGFDLQASVISEGTGWCVKMSSQDAYNFHSAIGFRSARKSFAHPVKLPQLKRRQDRFKVTSVEQIGEHESYDLTIEDRPYFDANGLLTHNTPEEAFISTGKNIFPVKKLAACYQPEDGVRGILRREGRRVLFVSDEEGELTIFRMPADSRDYGIYFVGGDPTHTTRGDYAAIQVINRRTYEQVAVWRGRIDPASFATPIQNLGRFYNDAFVTSEVEGPGYATIGALMESGYPYVWKKHMAEKLPGKVNDNYGWSTTHKTKEWAIGLLLKLVMDKDITIHDKRTFQEMRDYVTLPAGGYGPADPDSYDDLVMSLAIACICSSTEGGIAPYVGETGYLESQLEQVGSPVAAPWEDWGEGVGA